MPKPELKPEVKRFIQEVINSENSHKRLGGKNFAEIVAYAISQGYALSDTELLYGLNHYYDNKFPLPYWLQERLAGLAIWKAWENRG